MRQQPTHRRPHHAEQPHPHRQHTNRDELDHRHRPGNGQTYTYSVKYFDEPSCYGIRNGRVSKLEIRLAGQVVLNYSRGWDVRAQDAATRQVRDAILKRFN